MNNVIITTVALTSVQKNVLEWDIITTTRPSLNNEFGGNEKNISDWEWGEYLWKLGEICLSK